jgi:hypothetical protein
MSLILPCGDSRLRGNDGKGGLPEGKNMVAPTWATPNEGKNIVAPTWATSNEGKNIVAPTWATSNEGKNMVARTRETIKLGEKVLAGSFATSNEGKKVLAGSFATPNEGKKVLAGSFATPKEGKMVLAGSSATPNEGKKVLEGSSATFLPVIASEERAKQSPLLLFGIYKSEAVSADLQSANNVHCKCTDTSSRLQIANSWGLQSAYNVHCKCTDTSSRLQIANSWILASIDATPNESKKIRVSIFAPLFASFPPHSASFPRRRDSPSRPPSPLGEGQGVRLQKRHGARPRQRRAGGEAHKQSSIINSSKASPVGRLEGIII